MHTDISTKIQKLQGQEHVLIAVLDSGLGGLSICAELEAALQVKPLFKRVSLIYFNVWPEQGRGYNSFCVLPGNGSALLKAGLFCQGRPGQRIHCLCQARTLRHPRPGAQSAGRWWTQMVLRKIKSGFHAARQIWEHFESERLKIRAHQSQGQIDSINRMTSIRFHKASFRLIMAIKMAIMGKKNALRRWLSCKSNFP